MNLDLGDSLESLQQAHGQSSFGPARFFLSREKREGLGAFYAYCRAVDDAADDLPRARGKAVLANWKKILPKLRRSKPGSLPPQAEALALFSKRYQVPVSLFRELIAGAESDMRPRVRFKNQTELDRYCHQVAGVVGLACLPLFEVDPQQGRSWAEALGRALQKINFVRDAAEDAARGRIYFPMDDFKRHRVREKSWLRGEPGPGGQALLIEAGEAARAELERAWRMRETLEGKFKAPDLMADVYGELLKRMLADGCRSFERRYEVPKVVKIKLLLRRWWRAGR